jgi:hypothetical protein
MTTTTDRAEGVKTSTWTLVYSSLSVNVWESQDHKDTYMVDSTGGPSKTFTGKHSWIDVILHAGLSAWSVRLR